MVNQVNLALLRETLIAAEAAGEFDMDKYIHPCGSPSCIIGWVDHLVREETAAEWLGVSTCSVAHIYAGWMNGGRPDFPTVLRFLDVMRDEDRVPNWREVR